ncbi:alpha-(1-_3)-arabinofuranosyltransferase family protein, partial [Kibdelosporangium lantanae]
MTRLRNPTVWVLLGLTLLSFLQRPGRTTFDTKLDLVVDPLAFLGRALHLWNPAASGGEQVDRLAVLVGVAGEGADAGFDGLGPGGRGGSGSFRGSVQGRCEEGFVSGSRRGFGEFHGGEALIAQDVLLEDPVGGFEGHVVAALAVVEDRVGVVGQCHQAVLAAFRRFAGRGG